VLRRISCLGCAVFLCACAKVNNESNMATVDTAAAPAPAPAALTLNDFVGTWDMKARRADNDSAIVGYELVATADTNNWQVKFADRSTGETAHVLAQGGDSVVLHAGPYESIMRKGVHVTTHGIYHLQNGVLSGTTVARYDVKTADSVLTIKASGTKKQ